MLGNEIKTKNMSKMKTNNENEIDNEIDNCDANEGSESIMKVSVA
jgi:hypothetical protein